MPRDGSGNYSLPGGSTAVSGATISSSAFNTMTGDLATALTGSVPRDGTGAMTAPLKQADGTAAAPAYTFGSATNVGMYRTTNGIGLSAGGALIAEVTSSGILNGSGVAYQVTPTIAWADVASGTTTDIGAVANLNQRITGTVAITSFGTSATGTTRTLRFAGALILTYNATSMILPTSANITTAAGDTCVAVSLGSGNWVVTDYQRLSGAALVDNNVGTVTSVATGGGVAGGPVTSSGTITLDTNNAMGVGATSWLQNNSGGSITNGSTTLGTNLTILYGSGGSFVSSGSTASGTWRNVSGITLANNQSGMWIRTA